MSEQPKKRPLTLSDDDIKTTPKGGRGMLGQLGQAGGPAKSLSTDPRMKERVGDPDAG